MRRALRACAPVEVASWYGRHIERWSEPRFGLSFAAGRRIAANTVWETDFEPSALLAPEAPIAPVDPHAEGAARVVADLEFTVSRAGMLHAIAAWSSAPADGVAAPQTSSGAPGDSSRAFLLPVDPPVLVDAGDRIRVSLRLDPGRHPIWTWRVRVAAGDDERADRRHSTFQGMLLDLEGAAKERPDFSPTLSPRGRARLDRLRALA